MRLQNAICRAVLVVVALAAAHPLYAQAVKATLLGNITDASGAAVPAAKVLITDVGTGIARSSESNQSGNYVFANLDPGRYNVTVERQGFRTVVQKDVDVLVNSAARVDVRLQPGEVTESITVSAESGVLQTDRSDTGRKIETRQVQDLPLGFNRNFH
ncbi:MAG TPA: TonB-dependent receptor, partial [Solibacterales bacterium]|nr:TonB-dependent receptor [Bryobacterales bacterium]